MNEPQTLAQRLAQGRIPAPEAQRYAMLLAEALRKIHEAGEVHGGVSPASIMLTGSSLELGPAPRTKGEITPYTAPELLEGQPPDSRSDVFAFGAVVYEMFSGRQAFEGDSEAETLVGFARLSHATQIYIARPKYKPWQRLFTTNAVHQIVRLAPDLRLIIVAERHAAHPAPA